MNHTTSLLGQLDEITRRHQAHLESLPYSTAMSQGTLPMEAYLGQLQALSVVHGVLETTLDGLGDPLIASHWDPELKKGPLLEADLAALHPAPEGRPTPADESALRITERIRLRSMQDPGSLLGYLLAFHDPTARATGFSSTVEKLFGLSAPTGVRYLSSFPEKGVEGPWQGVRQELETAVQDPARRATILAAAEEACQGFEEILSALFPLPDRTPPLQAVGLNPEAGRHPVPNDPREVQAAIRAGRETWETFPYFGARYEKRGEKFTNSDGAWLVTLTELPQEGVNKQVHWLSRVMATRGMPRLLLEESLRDLHGALSDAVPEKAAEYRKLQVAADELRASRCGPLDEDEQDALAREFHARSSRTAPSVQMRGAGRVLVSAVMDEVAGMEGVVESVRSWMTDPARFPEPWAEAVDHTLARVREQARSLG